MVDGFPALVAECLPDEIMVIRKDFKVVWCNRKAKETYESDLIKDVRGQTCYWVTHRLNSPCREPMHVCPLYQAMESGQPCCVTHEHYGSDGEKVHMEITVIPLPGGDCFLHMARDVTDSIRQSALQEEMWIAIIGQMERVFADLANSQTSLDAYAERLKESETRYRLLYENASVGLYRTRVSDGFILMANDNYARMLGYDRAEELIGQSIQDRYIDPTKRQEWICALREREVRQFEMEMLRRDGSQITVCRSGRLCPENDCIEGAVVDITARKQMEKALIQSEKLRALGEMASGVAHDFNNILSTIIANAQMLEPAVTDPDCRRRLNLIEIAAKDGAETIKRIQEFSRVRKDKNFQAIDFNTLIEQVVLITSPRWKDQSQRQGKTITLNTDMEPLAPLAGNAAELKEVITNLIFNAVDAMPKGGEITIRTRQEGGYACLSIKDTGAGMPPHVRRRVFDPFFTTKGVTNSGLGLSVSYGIIHRHDGHIEVESQEGEGTAFTIRLPVNEGLVTRKEEEKPEKVVCQEAHILLVDDEEMILETLSEVLESDGHKVVAANGGREGLARFQEGAFDLVLTDLGMPEMSGWELAAAIKQIDPAMPVAMITGWGAEFTSEQLKARGIDLIMAKPFECAQISGLVAQAMELRQKALGGQRPSAEPCQPSCQGAGQTP
jgi:PAS domain S-box-containing protein